jgi:hypothetical protein
MKEYMILKNQKSKDIKFEYEESEFNTRDQYNLMKSASAEGRKE